MKVVRRYEASESDIKLSIVQGTTYMLWPPYALEINRARGM